MSPPVSPTGSALPFCVDSMIPYTRGILRDYGLTSLVTGIKALGMYETGDLAKSKRGV